MTVSGGALTLAAAAIGLLLLSGLWVEWRYRGFARLPVHFDGSGRATRLAPRRVVIWSTPTIFVGLNGFIVFLVQTLPRDDLRGEPDEALMIVAIVLLGAQLFILWLVERWARGGG
ncbi:MAG: hypothetical protein RIC51_00655 [Erythrobacter sp.]|uniref:hypothetical protein n=1 Tax=Erythrobacter sp. TaxID=1042 RepID=UPI0032EA94A4